MSDNQSENLQPVPPPHALPRRQADIINKEINPQAAQLLEQHVLDYGSSLLLQAKLAAHRRGDDVVLRSHVEEALEVLKNERKQKGWKLWVPILGGILFGTGARGFITELQGARDPLMIAIYAIMAFIGLVMVLSFQR